MVLPMFWARSKINWSKKWHTSRLYEIRSVNGVVGALHNSRDWISLKAHRLTPPTILWSCQNFGLDPKSNGQRNWTLQVLKMLVIGGLHSSSDWISLKTHQMTPPTIL